MSTILKLLKLQIDNKTDLLKFKLNSNVIVGWIKKLLLLIAITAVVAFALIRIFVLGFKINAELLAILLVAMQIVSLFFAVSNIISNLYFSKDNQLLMCLPATSNQLFISKLLLVYLQEIVNNAVVSLPIFISIGIIGGGGIQYYLCIPLFLMILPLLPIVLASFISIPIMLIMRFLKKHTILSIVTIVLLVAAVFTGYMVLIANIAESFDIAYKQIETVIKINTFVKDFGSKLFIYYQLGNSMFTFTSWWWILIYLVMCSILVFFTIIFTRYYYFKTATMLFESNVIKVKDKKYNHRSPFMSLLFKEIYCIFRSPGAVFEYFLFTLLMPFIVVAYDKLLMSITVNEAGTNMIAGSHVMVVAIMALLSNIVSASTISRDGGSFYISKIVPVNYYKQIFAKLAFNAIFTTASLLVTMIISFFTYPAWQVILSTLAVLFTSIGHIALSIDMDIKDPTINMQGNEDAANVGKNTTKSILYALFFGVLLGLVVILMANVKISFLSYLIILLFGIVFCIYRIYILILRINLRYDKIEM